VNATRESTGLGGYDGVDLWTLRGWNLTGVHEQVFASLHERMHHELQSTTLWGLITRFADDFLRDPRYRVSGRLLFWVGVMRAQSVHETYATTLAAGIDADFCALLDHNAETSVCRSSMPRPTDPMSACINSARLTSGRCDGT
jgi:hypothetical protein